MILYVWFKEMLSFYGMSLDDCISSKRLCYWEQYVYNFLSFMVLLLVTTFSVAKGVLPEFLRS